MANGAKVCCETCDRDLGEDTAMARTEFGSQHVLRKKSTAVSDQGRWSLPADTLLPLRLNSSPLVLRGDSHPISGTKVGEGHLSPCTLAVTLPSPQLRSHKLQLFACGPGKKITTFIFLIEHTNQSFISNDLPVTNSVPIEVFLCLDFSGTTYLELFLCD